MYCTGPVVIFLNFYSLDWHAQDSASVTFIEHNVGCKILSCAQIMEGSVCTATPRFVYLVFRNIAYMFT